MRALLALALAVSLVTAPASVGAAKAKAIAEAQLARSRVLLSDLVPNAPEEVATIDLGASPQPGSSRLVTREEMVAALPEGFDARSLQMPASVRVVRKARKLMPAEIEKMTRDAISEAGVPRNGTLTAVRPRAAVTVPAGWESARVDLPRPPRKSGKHLATATLLLLEGETVLARLPVPVELALPKSAAIPDVKKGSKLQLVIERSGLEIKAMVSAAADADVGEELPVMFENRTVIKAKLVSKDPPAAVEAR